MYIKYCTKQNGAVAFLSLGVPQVMRAKVTSQAGELHIAFQRTVV